jgi:hypothetical protein
MSAGIVEAVYITSGAGQTPVAVPWVRAVPGKGLEGDRYFLGRGSSSRWPGEGRQVSMIEAEAIEEVLAQQALDLREGRSRRKLVTRGVALRELQGKTFRLGSAPLRGVRSCPLCRYLERRFAPTSPQRAV